MTSFENIFDFEIVGDVQLEENKPVDCKLANNFENIFGFEIVGDVQGEEKNTVDCKLTNLFVSRKKPLINFGFNIVGNVVGNEGICSTYDTKQKKYIVEFSHM